MLSLTHESDDLLAASAPSTCRGIVGPTANSLSSGRSERGVARAIWIAECAHRSRQRIFGLRREPRPAGASNRIGVSPRANLRRRFAIGDAKRHIHAGISHLCFAGANQRDNAFHGRRPVWPLYGSPTCPAKAMQSRSRSPIPPRGSSPYRSGGYGSRGFAETLAAFTPAINQSILNGSRCSGADSHYLGTGLGPVSFPDNIAPRTAGNVSTPVTVAIGGIPASIQYSGRTPCSRAWVRIVVIVPNSVFARLLGAGDGQRPGGVVSNTTTMAIAAPQARPRAAIPVIRFRCWYTPRDASVYRCGTDEHRGERKRVAAAFEDHG